MAGEGHAQVTPPQTPPSDEQEPKLKYLGNVLSAGQIATGYVATIYELAKGSSGPLKPGVDSLETRVKTIVGPVYEKFEGKPVECLEYIDKKVAESLVFLDSSVPQTVKDKTHQAYDIAKQAPDAAKAIVNDLQKNGLYESAKTYYIQYEPVAGEWTAETLKKLKSLPVIPFIIDFVSPSALYGAGQYNKLVSILKEKNVPLSGYIPLVPVEILEKPAKPEVDSKPTVAE